MKRSKLKEHIKEMLPNYGFILNNRQSRILELRDQGVTLREIGGVFDICAERVRSIEHEAFREMRRVKTILDNPEYYDIFSELGTQVIAKLNEGSGYQKIANDLGLSKKQAKKFAFHVYCEISRKKENIKPSIFARRVLELLNEKAL